MSMTDNIQETEELVNKIKEQIKTKENDIEKNFTKLGKAYYEKHGHDQTGEFYGICQEVISQYKEISEMDQQILELTLEDPKICPNCGTKNTKDSLFCGECGHKLPDENTCPNCGALVQKGDRFCRSCGSKIDHEDIQIEQVPKQRICVNCGEPLEEDAVFCIYCGTKND